MEWVLWISFLTSLNTFGVIKSRSGQTTLMPYYIKKTDTGVLNNVCTHTMTSAKKFWSNCHRCHY